VRGDLAAEGIGGALDDLGCLFVFEGYVATLDTNPARVATRLEDVAKGMSDDALVIPVDGTYTVE